MLGKTGIAKSHPRGRITVLGRLYFARQATTLLKFAKSTSNPELAASLIERAANLKARIDAVEKPIPSPYAPDVELEPSRTTTSARGRTVLRRQ
jgi:hypothetical protein